ncbi:MAG: sugar phosphate isomerase/epimerase [Novosphingobium sp.]|nr:sugar phosphate isomerase/epimerase [Novosphingobium sp.]
MAHDGGDALKAAAERAVVPRNRLSLEMLTLMGMPPVEHVHLAAELGCDGVSLGQRGRMLAHFGYADFRPYPDWSLLDDPGLVRATRAALAETGIAVSLAEGFRVLPGADIADCAHALDIMAELGAAHVNGGSNDPDMERSFDQLSLLAEMVRERGMRLALEFAPSNALKTLESALLARDRIGRDRCALLLDAMHFFRSGATLDDLAALDPGAIGCVQLCDVPLVSRRENYIEEAMFERRVPGEGELPLRDWLALLPGGIWIGLEVPGIEEMIAGTSPRDWAARVVAGARALGV